MERDRVSVPTALAVEQAKQVVACCADVYTHPAARYLMGDSFHPGGLALTSRVAALAGVDASSVVLDVGSGRGASAVHLAVEKGCRVHGLTVERQGVEAGLAMASERGVAERVSFALGDIMDAPIEASGFDVALMECVLSILPDKAGALERVGAALRPGGRLVVTDVTVSGPVPEELQGVLAIVGCVGDARTLAEYQALIEGAGLRVDAAQDLPESVAETLRSIRGRLLMAELGVKLGKLPIDASLIEQAKQLLGEVQRLVAEGRIGYGMLLATKPPLGA